MSTLLFVHGTGVRNATFSPSLDRAIAAARRAGIQSEVVGCPWGEVLGVDFEGKSLPDGASPEWLQQEEEDLARWQWLIESPLHELEMFGLPDRNRDRNRMVVPLPIKQPWQVLLDKISQYTPSVDVQALLVRMRLDLHWADAFNRIVASQAARAAFGESSHELPDVSRVLARALMAELQRLGQAVGVPLPNRQSRQALVDFLMRDWKQQAFGLGDRLTRILEQAATRHIQRHRGRLNEIAALPIGDILLYQSRHADMHAYLRTKIAQARPPVLLLGHSLGGIACFDLLATAAAGNSVRGLITAGSQAPMLYEMRALMSLQPPTELPVGFPPWLNLFDRSDFLSFIAKKLFPQAEDFEVCSHEPFPASHSAYFILDTFWNRVREFEQKCLR